MNPEDETQKEEALQRLLSRSYFYLQFRPRTVHEMLQYLQKKAAQFSYDETLIEDAISYLLERNYLNDQEFIDSYVSSRALHKQKGRVVLKNELLKKGVASSLIDEYFESHPLDESVLARQALSKIWPRIRTLESLKRFKKATDYLARRGFPYDIIKKTIEELTNRG